MCAWDIPDDLSKPGFLAIAQRGIGDALTLLPSLRALRAARADVRIELVAPGLLVLAENARDTATIVDDRPLAALDDDERARWLRTRNFAWVWNTELFGVLKGKRLMIQIKADFVMDVDAKRAVDGNFLVGRLPTGDQIPGGTFWSWVTLSPAP